MGYDEKTIVRGLKKLAALSEQADTIKRDMDRIREWLGANANGYTGTVGDQQVSVTVPRRWSVDNKSLKAAAVDDASLLDGLSCTWSVPAAHQPTVHQLAYMELKDSPAKITWKKTK